MQLYATSFCLLDLSWYEWGSSALCPGAAYLSFLTQPEAGSELPTRLVPLEGGGVSSLAVDPAQQIPRIWPVGTVV